MSRMMTWFYCQKIENASFFIITATVVFIVILTSYPYQKVIKPFLLVLLGIWVFLVLQNTLGLRTGEALHKVCWIPFQSYRDVQNGANPELLRSNYMNVLLFYPAGVLLAALLEWPGKHRISAVFSVICCGLFSLGIELAQYHYSLGCAETDDVIHNTLGVILGFLLYFLVCRISAPLLEAYLSLQIRWALMLNSLHRCARFG